MLIAVPTDGHDPDAAISDRFGRCQRFLLVDSDNGDFSALNNDDTGDNPGIVGAQSLIRRGVNAVIASNCGPKACQLLEAAGVHVVTGVSGRIRDALAVLRLPSTPRED